PSAELRRPATASSATMRPSANGSTMTIGYTFLVPSNLLAMIRLHTLLFVLLCAICGLGYAADPAKVLHLATSDIDTLDPQQWQDAFSRDVGASIFESMYEWDYLARPPTPSPDTAAGPPQISVDGL